MNNVKRVLKTKEGMLLGIIIISVAVISIGNPVFWRLDNLMDILKNCVVLGILSCGMLLVVLTGGIDVSVGAVTAACACIVGTFLMQVSDNIFLALLVGVGAGALMGLANGLLVARLQIPPIVATLGTVSYTHLDVYKRQT